LFVDVDDDGGAACSAARSSTENQIDGEWQKEPQELDVFLGRSH